MHVPATFAEWRELVGIIAPAIFIPWRNRPIRPNR